MFCEQAVIGKTILKNRVIANPYNVDLISFLSNALHRIRSKLQLSSNLEQACPIFCTSF